MFRPLRPSLIPPLLLLVAGLTAVPARAQKGTPSSSPTPGKMFREVFGADAPITGENGYEDLVLAAESLSAAKLYREFNPPVTLEPPPKPPPVLTLTARRQILGERAAQRALALIRSAVTKPVVSPRATLTGETTFPEMSGFRSLARLLEMLQYVQLADGRTTDAIGTARLCLRMGQIVQTDNFLTGSVGVAIQGFCLSSLAAHLDQLSARDCELLLGVCREWLAQPTTGEAMWKGELVQAQQFVAALRAAGPEGAPDVPDRMLALTDTDAREIRGRLTGLSAAELDSLASRASEEVRGYFARAREELQKPAWQRNRGALRPDAASSLAWLTTQFLRPLDRTGDMYTRESTRVRLLACHAVILRYRWEKNALPPNLDALNLGELAQDPFTGQPFQYRPRRRQYRLVSAGAPAEADDSQAVDGRRPVSLTPEE